MAAHVRVARRERLRGRQVRRPRMFRDRSNPLEELDGDQVFLRYRFRPETIMFIMGCLPNLATPTLRNMPVPPLLQLLITLRYLATGSMHLLIGDSLNVSRSTAGRVIRRVTSLLCTLRTNFIKFPAGQDAVAVKNGFFKVAGFPNVLGCIDGTFIRLRRPIKDEQDFVNRKGYHSLNVQMCCDHKFKVTSCAASWPGSVHDSRMFRSSELCTKFENGTHSGILLGDSGYPCRYFLMTPFINPNLPAKESYNRALCRTRVLIEQTFGILKRRFQILHFEMSVQPQQAVINTVASVVLHNIGIDRGDIINVDEIVLQDEDVQPEPMLHAHRDGAAVRDHIMNTYFS